MTDDPAPRGPVLLSLGSVNADFQVRVAETPGRSSMLSARDLTRLSGGKAANVALFARRLGHPSALLGRVGDDDLAEQALGPLRAAGVDLAGVRRGRGATGVAMVLVPPDGRKHIAAAGEANRGYDDADIAALLARIDAAPPGSVLAADYEISPRAVSRAVARARARGLRVVVDPSFPDQVPREDLRAVDALTPNTREALALAGIGGEDEAAIGAAARALAALGPSTVCIKLDAGGCLVRHGGRSWHQRAAPVEVVDATGAGDAFTAAFAIALLEGRAVEEAVRRAVAASELAVMAWGAQPSYPDRARWEARLALPRESGPWAGEEGGR
jgi:ribokinase